MGLSVSVISPWCLDQPARKIDSHSHSQTHRQTTSCFPPWCQPSCCCAWLRIHNLLFYAPYSDCMYTYLLQSLCCASVYSQQLLIQASASLWACSHAHCNIMPCARGVCIPKATSPDYAAAIAAYVIADCVMAAALMQVTPTCPPARSAGGLPLPPSPRPGHRQSSSLWRGATHW